MWITVIADASHCPKTMRAGYGFLVACQRGKEYGEGAMDRAVENNIGAEMAALLIAVQHALDTGLAVENDALLLQTDCEQAITTFYGFRRKVKQQEVDIANFFWELVKKKRLRIRFKHVKGHSCKKDARSISNNICDHKARKNMRLERAKYLLTKEEGLNEN